MIVFVKCGLTKTGAVARRWSSLSLFDDADEAGNARECSWIARAREGSAVVCESALVKEKLLGIVERYEELC